MISLMRGINLAGSILFTSLLCITRAERTPHALHWAGANLRNVNVVCKPIINIEIIKVEGKKMDGKYFSCSWKMGGWDRIVSLPFRPCQFEAY